MKRITDVLKAGAHKNTPALITARIIATESTDGTLTIWRHRIVNNFGAAMLLVDIHKLTGIINGIGVEKMQIADDGSAIQVINGKRRAKITCVPFEPDQHETMGSPERTEAALNGFEAVAHFELNEDKTKDLFALIAPAMSNEEARYYLNGVHIGDKGRGNRITATNGHVISTMPIGLNGDVDVIVPRQAIDQLKRLRAGINGAVSFTIGKNETVISCECDGELVYICAHHIEANYPDYQRVIPDKTPWMVFETASAQKEIKAIKKAAGLTRNGAHGIAFIPGKDSVKLVARNDNIEIETEIKGRRLKSKPEKVWINAFLMEDVALKLGQRVTAYIDNEMSPCRLESADKDITIVIVTMRL